MTGSSGFIGRHVVEALLDRGHSVVEIVRPERRAEARTENVVEFGLDSPPQDAFQRLGRPDAIVHLAWGGLPNYSSAHHVEEEYPLHADFLSDLANQGFPRIVVAGTCFEYGLKEGVLKETDPVAPVTEYARAKALLHQQILERAPDTEIIWARLFYPYGSGQNPASLYGQWHSACESGAEFFPMSPGDQLRDYLPVEEMADYLAQLAVSDCIGTRAINVCSGHPITVRQLVEQWAEDCNSKVKLQVGAYPYPAHEPRNAWGDDTVLRTLLQCRFTGGG